MQRATSTAAQRIGDAGEALIASRLEGAGWTILARNVRVGRDELDLVAIDPGPPRALVVVEVCCCTPRSPCCSSAGRCPMGGSSRRCPSASTSSHSTWRQAGCRPYAITGRRSEALRWAVVSDGCAAGACYTPGRRGAGRGFITPVRHNAGRSTHADPFPTRDGAGGPPHGAPTGPRAGISGGTTRRSSQCPPSRCASCLRQASISDTRLVAGTRR
jgi:hypothetical protein